MKKAFTVLEILFVIILIGILVYSIRNIFTLKQRDIINAETCSNYIYGKVRSFLDGAQTGKGFYTGSNWVYPDKYIINFNESNYEISFEYSSGTTNGTIDKIYTFSGSQPEDGKYKCWNKNGFITFSGSYKIIINKQLQGDITNAPFVINSGTNEFVTGAVLFKYCLGTSPNCKELMQLYFDKRTYNLISKKCMKYSLSSPNICQEWNSY